MTNREAAIKVIKRLRGNDFQALLGGQLAANGIAVVRCRQGVELSEHYGLLKKIQQRRWATMAVTIFERCE